MLSYRHGFHAGNHADVLKHAVLSLLLSSLAKKAKPFTYIDTHAGAGIYELDSERARQTGESEAGICRILAADNAPSCLGAYVSLCREYAADGNRYPGSPEIALRLSRAEDQLVLMDLHPAEIAALRGAYLGSERVHLHQRDGFAGLVALTPPQPRRGLALVDPSYELASDFGSAAETIVAARRRWPVGVLALWYPRLARRARELGELEAALAGSGPEVLRAEIGVIPAGDGEWGMTGSAVAIVNPPWTLEAELSQALPWLARTLEPARGTWSLDWLSPPE